MEAQTGQRPTLWQIDISHYSEKVRWALDHKRIDHVRRSPLPGTHIPIALWLTRGRQPTFPVMTVGSRTIPDSTEIIAALESIEPEPPLYPAAPEQRARAIELEEWFDEELGPYTRFLVFHELLNEPEIFAEVASRAVPGPFGKVKPLVGAYARGFTRLRWADLTAASLFYPLVLPPGAPTPPDTPRPPALDRFRAELADRPGFRWVEDTYRQYRLPR